MPDQQLADHEIELHGNRQRQRIRDDRYEAGQLEQLQQPDLEQERRATDDDKA
jgi:hypothetical protein